MTEASAPPPAEALARAVIVAWQGLPSDDRSELLLRVINMIRAEADSQCPTLTPLQRGVVSLAMVTNFVCTLRRMNFAAITGVSGRA